MLEISDKEIGDEYESIFFDGRTGKIALSFRDKTERTGSQYSYTIMAVVEEGKSISLKDCGTMKQKETNELMWAPNGNYFVLLNKMKGSPD